MAGITTRRARRLRPYARAQKMWLERRKTHRDAQFPMAYSAVDAVVAMEYMMRGMAREARVWRG